MRIRPAGTDGWKAATLTPEQFADRIDSAQKKLKNQKGEYRYMLAAPEGRGKAEGDLLIKTPTTYRLQAPVATKTSRDLAGQIYVANGTRSGMIVTGGWKNVVPVGARPSLLDENLRSRWALRMGRYAVAGIAGPDRTFTRLVKELRSSNHKIQIETRSIAVGSGKSQYFRLIARPNNSSDATIEVVTSPAAEWNLLTLRGKHRFGSGLHVASWTARWLTAVPKDFPPKKFDIPKK